MTMLLLIATIAFVTAAVACLLITQSKHRVQWQAWLVPVLVAVPLGSWIGHAVIKEGGASFVTLISNSFWGSALWLNTLTTSVAAFFLLQNRARAAGMKSEVWVLLVIFTGGVGLLGMLATMLYLERRNLIDSGKPELTASGQAS